MLPKRKYVVGFRFAGDRFLSIRKNRPDWQAGCLNGVGGKVEQGETDIEAMVREFHEETGLRTSQDEWSTAVTLVGNEWTVHVFRSFGSISGWIKTTDEDVVELSIDEINQHETIHNFHWLVLMLRDPRNTLDFPFVIPYRVEY